MGSSLRGCRLLLADDDFLVAEDFVRTFEDVGAVIIGPVNSLEAAFHAIGMQPRIDGAILETLLQGELTFGLADAFTGRRIPVAFTTGLPSHAMPTQFRHHPRLSKPLDPDVVLQALFPAGWN